MKIHTSILTGLVLAAWAATAFAQDPTPISVETGTVEKEYMASRMPVSGVVISREDARIAAELAGRLTWIAEVGDQLQQGDVIARLESHLIELQRRDSEAAIKGLQANLAWVNRQTRRLEELATRNNTAHSELDEMRSRSIMLQQELIQANKMISLGTLVSGVAHEINNPNNVIVLNAPVLQTMFSDLLPALDAYHEEHGPFSVGARSYEDVRKTVPLHVASAMSRALEKLPADRFESADAFREALANEGFRHTPPTGLQAPTTGYLAEPGGTIPLVALARDQRPDVEDAIRRALEAMRRDPGG